MASRLTETRYSWEYYIDVEREDVFDFPFFVICDYCFFPECGFKPFCVRRFDKVSYGLGLIR